MLSVKTIIEKPLRFLKRVRLQNYVKRNSSQYTAAPYKVDIYSSILTRIHQHPSFKFIRFDQKLATRTGSAFVFRHDLDTPGCLKNATKLAELHEKHDVPLASFIRTDGLDYPISDIRKSIANYSSKVQIGLHSSCYIQESPLEALSVEIQKFEDIMGFSPKLMTIHGLGEYKLDSRLKLIKELAAQYSSFGLEFCDFLAQHRHYDYVVQDCHLNEYKERFIKDDFLTLPPPISGTTYLVLSHPCYWSF